NTPANEAPLENTAKIPVQERPSEVPINEIEVEEDLISKLVTALRRRWPKRRPLRRDDGERMRRIDILNILQTECQDEIGEPFGMRSLDRALKIAWLPKRRRRSR